MAMHAAYRALMWHKFVNRACKTYTSKGQPYNSSCRCKHAEHPAPHVRLQTPGHRGANYTVQSRLTSRNNTAAFLHKPYDLRFIDTHAVSLSPGHSATRPPVRSSRSCRSLNIARSQCSVSTTALGGGGSTSFGVCSTLAVVVVVPSDAQQPR